MRRSLAVWLLPLPVIGSASVATAQERSFDLPAGPLGIASDALSHQAAISVVLADPAMQRLPVPALRGRMTASEAVHRLARSAGAEALRLGSTGWKLTSMPARPPARSCARPAIVPREATGPEADVIVVASKRTTPLNAFAGSVETIELPPIGIEGGSQALVTRSTVISSTYRGAGREKLFISGLSDSSFSGRLQSVTGLYFGDVRLTYSASDPDLQLYDVGSVEVLQGPQGTLYGSGSLAGIIRINPVMPKRGRTEAMIGGGVTAMNRGSQGADLNATINVPLTDNLAARAVGYVRGEPGYIDKPAVGRDVNRARIDGGRMIVRWWIDDAWTVDVTGIVQSSRSRDTQYATIGVAPLTDIGQAAEPFGSEYAAAHLVVSGRIGAVDVVSATGIASQDFHERFAVPFFGALWVGEARRMHHMVTHESRFSRRDDDGTSWVAGLSYTRPINSSTTGAGEVSVPISNFDVRNTVSEMAVFGEGAVHITPFLTLGAGARAVQAINNSRLGLLNNVARTARRREQWLLPTASVVLRPLSFLSGYVRYQQGARPAAPSIQLDQVPETEPRERVSTVEAGVRWHPDTGWTATASIARTRLRQLQIDTLEAFAGIIGGDAGDWRLLSAHVAVSGPILSSLRIDAAATFNSNTSNNPFFEGIRVSLPDIAGVIARAEATWSQPVGSAAMLHVNMWARYEGTSYGAILFYDRQRQGNYVRTGVAVDLDRPADRLSLSIDNLLDDRGNRYALATLTRYRDITTPLRPLTVRISYLRRF